MRWQGARRSTNIEDRRGMGGAGMVGGGGIGLLLLVLLVSFITGRNPLELMQQVDTVSTDTSTPGAAPPANDTEAQFVSAVVGDTEDTWNRLFAATGRQYQEPQLVLFDGSVRSACGFAAAAVGPFYCPGDRKVYLDLSFFRELDRRFGAPGDFARAYVIAHEIGHHVQTLLGVSDRVHRAQSRGSESDANALSVRMELQADCLAGVWGHHAQQKQLLDQGDVEEGIRAAGAIGDDRLQLEAKGYVVPESFTHGSSAQRVSWFERGMRTGDVNACDTFSPDRP